mmetsp:Transcript_12459/g.19209  ORF Transcript_12459/g.19209 Transcript_12459/m.19209 type:complete len:336 (+) Transcript_12459:1418-2425(+)
MVVRWTGVERRWTVVVTSNPGLEQMILCTPSGTVHPLCNLSIPKEMADVMEVLLLMSGGSGADDDDDFVVIVVDFWGTVMDDMGFVDGDISKASSCCACAGDCDCGCFSLGMDPELELLLELLVLLILAFLLFCGRSILLGGGVWGRSCFLDDGCGILCCFLDEVGGRDSPATATVAVAAVETTISFSFFFFPRLLLLLPLLLCLLSLCFLPLVVALCLLPLLQEVLPVTFLRPLSRSFFTVVVSACFDFGSERVRFAFFFFPSSLILPLPLPLLPSSSSFTRRISFQASFLLLKFTSLSLPSIGSNTCWKKFRLDEDVIVVVVLLLVVLLVGGR